jgi:hypothetical protein
VRRKLLTRARLQRALEAAQSRPLLIRPAVKLYQ